jgi:hypothetical protein
VKKFLVGAALAAGMGLAGVAGAGVASAAPGVVDCSNPCVNRSVAAAAEAPTGTGAPWTDFFANGPWEPAFSADPWGQAFDATDGVPGDGQGAWEKAFPPAP